MKGTGKEEIAPLLDLDSPERQEMIAGAIEQAKAGEAAGIFAITMGCW